ncbi:response regulator [Ramlibacter henchirensis]|uniref:histidine kinase n=1 Tax=Ramlibacter henchirensis TaxID=204072 RepID=A0A4Z0C505_9BURK|nr:ATP-binding protein [Ramlibacter henchirensis]TFZ06012.1 response regulator [Ramlibacter henchirensis]
MSKRENEEPHGAHQRLQALATNTSTIVWYTAPDGSVSQVNPSWAAFTGQAFEAYRGWGWIQAVHPDDRPGLEDAWRAATQAKVPFDHAYRLRRHDGEYRHVQAQGTPVMEGAVLREWVGVCVDDTASRRAQVALQESELRFRFLDRLGQATRELTEAGELMGVTARMLGEYLGATRCAYADVEPDGDRFTIRNDWSVPGVPTSAGVYSLELFGPQATTNLRRGQHLVVRDVDRELGEEGGGRMFNAIGIKAIICAGLIKQGRLVAMMAVHQSRPRDWTEHEIALVGEVVDRCWAHIERVRDSAMLREQDRRKDEFLATLAHELRNPLAPIKYAMAMLRRSDDPERLARARDVVDRQVSQMARLIDDLLDLSRINRGLIRLQLEPHRVADLVREAVDVARPAIEEGRHQLQVRALAENVFVHADATRLVQVLGNLLGNAAKYTPEGGRIVVSGSVEGGDVLLEVADNGVGIPPADQDRVFQMFTQLEHTASRARGGLGIGLSLVKTLVQMHGGAVSVRSEGLGRGATFSVRLPRMGGAPALAPQFPRQAAAGESGDALRIAVVEDNDDGRASLVELLELLGHEVRSACDGAAGVELVRSFRPDLVLLDLGLPVMDGLEACRRIRSDPQLGATRVVALTGWGTDLDRERTAKAGFDLHLTKPVEAETLRRTVEETAAAAAKAPPAA